MALLDRDPASAPLTSENRRYQRVKVDLLGRYMLEDRREFPCQVTDMSPGGLAMIAPECGRLGERVVAYIDHVGRLEGLIARIVPGGFCMTIAASQRKRDKLVRSEGHGREIYRPAKKGQLSCSSPLQTGSPRLLCPPTDAGVAQG